MSRKLPPLASDSDRIEAARIAADRLAAELREASLVKGAWAPGLTRWSHYIDSAGGVHSEQL